MQRSKIKIKSLICYLYAFVIFKRYFDFFLANPLMVRMLPLISYFRSRLYFLNLSIEMSVIELRKKRGIPKVRFFSIISLPILVFFRRVTLYNRVLVKRTSRQGELACIQSYAYGVRSFSMDLCILPFRTFYRSQKFQHV